MPVVATCNPDRKVITVKVSAGQRLRHTVEDEAGVEFNLVNDAGKVMLETAKPARTLDWPSQEYPPPTGVDKHTLGMQFVAAATVTWKVELLSESGAVLHTVKSCAYVNDGGTHAHFNTIKVRVT